MNPYRQRVWALLQEQLAIQPSYASVLDFGCGDGWFARQMIDAGLCGRLEAIDVKRREQTLIEPTIYDGTRLPYADKEFELAYAVDVLHHCADPFAQILELARCSSRYLLIKDHTFNSSLGQWTLAVMDELGNRRFGIPSPYNYQQAWTWHEALQREGWRRARHAYPARVHVSILGKLTNNLQFVSLYTRADSK